MTPERRAQLKRTRSPRRDEKASKIRWGYCSETVPRSGMSWRRTTLWSEKYAVGPYGKWLITIASAARAGREVHGTVSTGFGRPGGNLLSSNKKADRTRFATVFVHQDQVRDVVGSARIGNVLDHVVAAVDLLRVGEDQPHFLCVLAPPRKRPPRPSQRMPRKVALPSLPRRRASGVRRRTLANWPRRELGSRDVVIRILGSAMPARAYSSSMWLVGAARIKRTFGGDQGRVGGKNGQQGARSWGPGISVPMSPASSSISRRRTSSSARSSVGIGLPAIQEQQTSAAV